MGTQVNPVIRYKLEQEASLLRHEGQTMADIARLLNDNPAVPPNVKITPSQVSSFFRQSNQSKAAIVQSSNKRLVKVVDQQINIIDETRDMYQRSKNLLDAMEEDSIAKGYAYVDAYRYKAVMSELRETMALIIELQREINDIENVKFFMQAVLTILRRQAPEVIPLLVE